MERLASADPAIGAQWRTLFAMAWPTVIVGWLRASYTLIDTYTAGQLSTEAQAGHAAAIFLGWMFHSASTLVAAGVLSVVARAAGANDVMRIGRVTRIGTALALGIGLLASIFLFVLAAPALTWMGVAEPARGQAVEYLHALAFFGPAYWLWDTFEQTLRARGQPRPPLVVGALLAVLNFVLNPILAHGLGPIPGLGLAGLGIATGVCWTFGALLLFLWLKHQDRRVALRSSAEAGEVGAASLAWAIVVVGLPVAVALVGFDLIWAAVTPVVAKSGPVALAGLGIGHRLESIAYMTSHGIAAACAAMAGHAVGAGEVALARRITARCALVSLAFGTTWSVLLLTATDTLTGIFTADPAVLEFCRTYVSLAFLGMVFQGVELVVVGGFEGFGRTLLPTTITLTFYALRIPLVALAASSGALGVVLICSVTATASGLGVALAFAIVTRSRRVRSAPPASVPQFVGESR